MILYFLPIRYVIIEVATSRKFPRSQEKFEREMSELTAKLREKESAYDELMRSRKVIFQGEDVHMV